MIETYSNNLAVTSNSPIAMQNVSIEKGCSVKLQGTSTFAFKKCGVYLIAVNATVRSTTATTGLVSIQLAQNGNLAADAISSETVGDAAGFHALSFSKLITVPKTETNCCCSVPTVVSINNVGVDATFSNINVTITRIC